MSIGVKIPIHEAIVFDLKSTGADGFLEQHSACVFFISEQFSIITLTGQRQFWTKPSPGRQAPNGQNHDTALHYEENRNMDVCAVGTAVFSRIPVVQSVHPFSRNS